MILHANARHPWPSPTIQWARLNGDAFSSREAYFAAFPSLREQDCGCYIVNPNGVRPVCASCWAFGLTEEVCLHPGTCTKWRRP